MATSALLLLDTNILIHLVRRDRTWERIRSRYNLPATDPKPLISVVTEGELRSFALQRSWGEAKLDQMEYALGYFDRVSITNPDVIQAYAVIDSHFQRRGQTLGKNDLWIAGTAVATGARLLTTDTDFDPLDPMFISRDWTDPSSESN
ncbi:MAG: type II toxin-antitoxin system VapC family toxin [Gemmataceae bacterium]